MNKKKRIYIYIYISPPRSHRERDREKERACLSYIRTNHDDDAQAEHCSTYLCVSECMKCNIKSSYNTTQYGFHTSTWNSSSARAAQARGCTQHNISSWRRRSDGCGNGGGCNDGDSIVGWSFLFAFVCVCCGLQCWLCVASSKVWSLIVSSYGSIDCFTSSMGCFSTSSNSTFFFCCRFPFLLVFAFFDDGSSFCARVSGHCTSYSG